MDYSLSITGLKRELCLNSNLSSMNKLPMILSILGLLPLVIYYLFLLVCYHILLFSYKMFVSPISYLEGIVRKESADVHRFTQAVIYFIGFPLIFFGHTLLSMISIVFHLVWFMLMLATFFLSFGGIKWQPYLSEATFSEESDSPYRYNIRAMEWYGIIIFIAFVFFAIMYFVASDSYDPTTLGIYRFFRIIYFLLFLLIPVLAWLVRSPKNGKLTTDASNELSEYSDSHRNDFYESKLEDSASAEDNQTIFDDENK